MFPLYQYHYQTDKYILFKTGKIYSLLSKKFLSSRYNNYGYTQFILVINGKRTNRLLHREIAKTFLPNPNNYLQVDHKDRNISNNNLSNLRWVSRSQNCLNRLASINKENYIYAKKIPQTNKEVYIIRIKKKGKHLICTTRTNMEDAIKLRDNFLNKNQHIIDNDY
tara:strand:- start:4154 stop:4651 length:498 start_codon:yes stop_codon:yes gene_type:complete